MNLAKIRQKIRNTLAPRQTVEAELPEQAAPVAQPASRDDSAASPVVAAGRPSPAGAAAAPVPESRQETPSRRARNMEPLEIILAGRAAAGCDDDLPLASEGTVAEEIEEYEEILCFRISDEIYGINIMELKEIIKPREATEVPRTPPFIMGVISLRGIIIPILNMRERLGLCREEQSGRERIVIVKRGDGFTGLLVDEVIKVVRIGKEGREPAPAVLEGIDRDFVGGIGRTATMMIILLNVGNITDINLS
ncbi:chemotaxis protein CheW [Geobacter sp. AOG2]|uniref:chemotaxis protein CheW n=1 Tax=Geobacter sp. AOG2 TaxID=1566347 RepID=UPI001CC50C9B|nr:chemotaxis protein CheW [Geobacter sp. AOG2]GFE61272.1 hypothetical protein AOG2_18590 [Geobacter sp. AOG2]